MAQCRCGDSISSGRLQLGMTTCLACGEALAKVEIIAKGNRIGPSGNKQGYEYLGDAESAKKQILHAGKKTESIVANPTSMGFYTAPQKVKPSIQKRRAIGVYYIGQECHTWYDGVDLATVGATRSARLRT